jgi:branched-chain amino acid transport system permease protein
VNTTVLSALVFGFVVGGLLASTCSHLRNLEFAAVTLTFGFLALAIVRAFPEALGTPHAIQFPGAIDSLDQQFKQQAFISSIGNLPGATGTRSADRAATAILSWASVVFGGAIFLRAALPHTRWGRMMRTIRESRAAAKASGGNTRMHDWLGFALSSSVVAATGTFAVLATASVSADSASQLRSFELVTFLVVGGIGSLLGPIVATVGLTLGLDWQPVADRLGANRELFFGLVVFVTVITARNGLAGIASAIQRRIFSQTQPRAEHIRVVADQPSGTGGILTIDDVSVSFGGVAALNQVSLSIEAGSVHGLIGPNGSGKSTLVDVISGFRAAEGVVVIDKRPLTAPSWLRATLHDLHRKVLRRSGPQSGRAPYWRRSQGLARTFQNLQLAPTASVADNVMVGTHLAISPMIATLELVLLVMPLVIAAAAWPTMGWSAIGVMILAASLWAVVVWRGEARARALSNSSLEQFGLNVLRNQPVESLAFADRRRVEFARAVALKPRVVLLDEPAAGLHADELAPLAEMIRTIAERGTSVLLIDHHMSLITEVCAQVTVLDRGAIIASGSPAEVLANASVRTAYLGEHAP